MSRTMFHWIPSLFLFSVMYTLLASSQIRVGVHGGVNLSDVTEPPNYDHAGTWEMQTYGFGGIVADFHIAQHWLLATEINFIQKGIRIPNSAWGLSLRGTTTLAANYYEVPLKIRYRSGGGPFGWYVEGGPSLGLLESGRAHTVTQAVGGMPYRDEMTHVVGMYHELETSLNVGLGGEYELTSTFTVTLSDRILLVCQMYMTHFGQMPDRGAPISTSACLCRFESCCRLTPCRFGLDVSSSTVVCGAGEPRALGSNTMTHPSSEVS